MISHSPPELYVRPYPEVRDLLLERARHGRNPFEYVALERAQAILDRLDTLERDRWAATFCEAAEPHLVRAIAAEAAGDLGGAQREYLAAYGLLRVARFPAPNSPLKREAYRRSQEAYLNAARFFDPPLERVEIAYLGDQAPGATIFAYLRRPKRTGPVPIVIQWGGIDAFKEERRADPYLAAGMAVLAMDMPGVGDAPIPGSERGEQLWDGVFEWIAAQPGLDERRVAIVGASTGGYWTAKLAHTHRDRIAAAVVHGGAVHFAFKPDWIACASRGEYAFELAETLASAHGRQTAAEWLEFAPRMSLLDQGVLDQPSAPLLLVNGIHDSVFPIEDMYLLLRHGSPKSARLFETGHMGHGPDLMPTIITWIAHQLSCA